MENPESNRDNLLDVATKIKDQVDELVTSDSAAWNDYLEELEVLCEKLPQPHPVEDKPAIKQIDASAGKLWDIARKEEKKGKQSTTLTATLRHTSFQLMLITHKCEDEAVLRKLIRMALQTARAWLDASNPSLAESLLDIASSLLERVQRVVEEEKEKHSGGGDVADTGARDTQQELIIIRCEIKALYTQALYTLERYDEAWERVKELDIQLQKLTYTQSRNMGSQMYKLGFNFGSQLYQKRLYHHATCWLNLSHDMSQRFRAADFKKQAQCLRLLANAYVDWDVEKYSKEALNAVNAANEEHTIPAGLYLKLKILVRSSATEEKLKEVLGDLLKHSELTEALGMKAISIIDTNTSADVAIGAMAELVSRFQFSPLLALMWLEHVKLLIKCERSEQAVSQAEAYILKHQKMDCMDENILYEFNQIFCTQGAKEFQAEDYPVALAWYKLCASLQSTTHSPTLRAKLYCNIATCYMQLHQLDKGLEAVHEAERCEVSTKACYLNYCINLMQGDIKTALEALTKLCKRLQEGHLEKSTEDYSSYYTNAMHLTMQQGKREAAVMLLEVPACMQHRESESLIALRCLIRLVIRDEEDLLQLPREQLDKLVEYLNLGHERLGSLMKNGQSKGLQEESTWFVKTAWNLAVRCSKDVGVACHFYSVCAKLCGVCPDSGSAEAVNQRKACSMMAAGALLHLAKSADTQEQKVSYLQECLKYVMECKQLVHTKMHNTDGGKDLTILCLYEFEARALLQQTARLGDVYEEALTIQQAAGPQLFEGITVVCLQNKDIEERLRVKVLKQTITCCLHSKDYKRCSWAFRHLVTISFSKLAWYNKTAHQELSVYYTDISKVIAEAGRAYPEEEVMWLCTNAWNQGIDAYRGSRLDEALQWCEMAMNLVQHVNQSQRNDYLQKMSDVYGELMLRKAGEQATVSL